MFVHLRVCFILVMRTERNSYRQEHCLVQAVYNNDNNCYIVIELFYHAWISTFRESTKDFQVVHGMQI